MKKIKFLPLFLVAPLLVGCNNVKSPKFAAYGSEVDAAQFSADLAAKYAESAFGKTDKIGSLLLKAKEGEYNSNKTVREDKLVVFDGESTETEETNIKYDANNAIIVAENVAKVRMSIKNQYGKSTEKSDMKQDMVAEAYEKDGKKYAINASKTSKTITSALELPVDVTINDYTDMMAKAILSGCGEVMNDTLSEYALSTDEEKANYKFYENGNIFTIEYNKKVENEEHKNAGDEVDYVTNMTKLNKIQLDMTDGAWKAKTYQEVKTKVEYKLTDGDHVKGEVSEIEFRKMEDMSAQYKDVKLKAIDVSGYAQDI